MGLGLSPVRVDPNGAAEVLWCNRLDPRRGRITSVPLPDWKGTVDLASSDELDELLTTLGAGEGAAEDWTGSVRALCA